MPTSLEGQQGWTSLWFRTCADNNLYFILKFHIAQLDASCFVNLNPAPQNST